jgi:hypothetical protein
VIPSDPKGFLNLPGLLVHGVFVAEGTEFLVIHPLRVFPFVLGGAVIPLFANFTGQGYYVSGHWSSSFNLN